MSREQAETHSSEERTPRELVVEMMGIKRFVEINRQDDPRKSSLLDCLEQEKLPDLRTCLDHLPDR